MPLARNFLKNFFVLVFPRLNLFISFFQIDCESIDAKFQCFAIFGFAIFRNRGRKLHGSCTDHKCTFAPQYATDASSIHFPPSCMGGWGL